MKSSKLLLELLRMTLASLLLYGILFIVLFVLEYLMPGLRGRLLQWSDPAFLVGIPASILGTAYVLTVRNPDNYTGFYFGILMSLLLSVQFYLQGSLDLVCLYLFVFIPFLFMAIRSWSAATDATASANAVVPQFLPLKQSLLVCLASACIILADLFLVCHMRYRGSWSFMLSNPRWFVMALMGAISIASSFFANYLMIYKKNDAWVCWLIYCLAGIVLFTLLHNLFSLLLFVVMFLVNLTSFVAWLRLTDAEHYGWLRPLCKIIKS